MRFLKTISILLLALLWATASNHCKLEQLPGLTFLACGDHEDTAQHDDEDCDTDGCASFENQLYKTENALACAPAPAVLSTLFLPPLFDESAAPAVISHVLPDAAPPGLPRLWQFSQRTALPPRAPSLLS